MPPASSHDDILTPIGGPDRGSGKGPDKASGKEASKKSSKVSAKDLDIKPIEPPKTRSFRRDVDMLICVLAALTGLGTLALSAYFFYGFTQTDSGFWTLANSFALCFFVGGLAYVPCFIFARTARRSAKGAASRKNFALALLLMLPWVCVSMVFVGASALPKHYGVLALILSLVFSIWAFSRLKRAPKPQKT